MESEKSIKAPTAKKIPRKKFSSFNYALRPSAPDKLVKSPFHQPVPTKMFPDHHGGLFHFYGRRNRESSLSSAVPPVEALALTFIESLSGSKFGPHDEFRSNRRQTKRGYFDRAVSGQYLVSNQTTTYAMYTSVYSLEDSE
jgi:hypothetical protein